jgi:hypothetical protein
MPVSFCSHCSLSLLNQRRATSAVICCPFWVLPIFRLSHRSLGWSAQSLVLSDRLPAKARNADRYSPAHLSLQC